LHQVSLFDKLSPTDEDLAKLDEVPNLKGLEISNTSNAEMGLLTEDGVLHFLQKHPFLTGVSLDTRHGGLELTDATLDAVCRCATLSELYIFSTPNRFTDAGTAHLKKLADHLVSLHLPGATDLTDSALAHVAVLHRLNYLNLAHSHVTDAGVCRLPQLLNLRVLSLWGTATGDRLLARLADSHQLHALTMAQTEITDAGLEHLVGIETLRELDLSFTAISDAGVRHLKRITRLKYLGLT
jgi:hypothetical protein